MVENLLMIQIANLTSVSELNQLKVITYWISYLFYDNKDIK
jgi:hypothetical protein